MKYTLYAYFNGAIKELSSFEKLNEIFKNIDKYNNSSEMAFSLGFGPNTIFYIKDSNNNSFNLYFKNERSNLINFFIEYYGKNKLREELDNYMFYLNNLSNEELCKRYRIHYYNQYSRVLNLNNLATK